MLEQEKSPLCMQQARKTSNISISDRIDFINTFFSDLSGHIEVREITKAGKARNVLFFNSVAKLLEYEPPQDMNVYIGMFTRKYKKGDKKAIKHTKALWLDIDSEQALYRLEYLINMCKIPEPTAVINSGNGKHIYYKLQEPAGIEIEPVLKKLARLTKADIRAAEAARIMRLPYTMNVKDKPLKCEILSLNDNTYSLQYFIELLDIKPAALEKAHRRLKQAELAFDINYEGIISSIDRPCIRGIMWGVPEGERNWHLGRLTKYFKNKAGFNKEKTRKIIRLWNLENNPPQKEQELLISFNKYWHTDYNLTGCIIKDKEGEPVPQLQQIINKYCDKEKCPLSDKIEFKKDEPVIEYNNWILYNIKLMSVYELIIYSVLSMNRQGLTATRAADIIGITKKTFWKYAKKSKFIKVKKGIEQRGIEDIYYLSRKGTYNLGRTLISYAAVRLLNSELKEQLIKPRDIKAYMLLRYYRYRSKSGEVYPALKTLAGKLGTSKAAISESIKRLEARDILYIDREKRRSNTYKFKIR